MTDPLQVGTLRVTSLLVGVLIAAAFFYVEYRGRRRAIARNGEVSSAAVFALKNGALAA